MGAPRIGFTLSNFLGKKQMRRGLRLFTLCANHNQTRCTERLLRARARELGVSWRRLPGRFETCWVWQKQVDKPRARGFGEPPQASKQRQTTDPNTPQLNRRLKFTQKNR